MYGICFALVLIYLYFYLLSVSFYNVRRREQVFFMGYFKISLIGLKIYKIFALLVLQLIIIYILLHFLCTV